jgi:hypothetical protein
MKLRYFYCIVLLTLLVSCAGRKRLLIDKRTFPVATMDKLKATTTVFFYSDKDTSRLDLFKKAVTGAWTLTPVVFANINDFYTYASDPRYSYFILERISIIVRDGNIQTNSDYIYLSLRVPTEVSRKGRIRTEALCRIELYPEDVEMMDLYRNRHTKNYPGEYLYKTVDIFNWNPANLYSYLQWTNANLLKSFMPGLTAGLKNAEALSELSKDTLFVPDYVTDHFSPYSGRSKGENRSFANYPFKYKICTPAELNERFLVNKTGRFLFDYVKSSNVKLISIYDTKRGELIYRTHRELSYNLKEKDINRIFR